MKHWNYFSYLYKAFGNRSIRTVPSKWQAMHVGLYLCEQLQNWRRLCFEQLVYMLYNCFSVENIGLIVDFMTRRYPHLQRWSICSDLSLELRSLVLINPTNCKGFKSLKVHFCSRGCVAFIYRSMGNVISRFLWRALYNMIVDFILAELIFKA